MKQLPFEPHFKPPHNFLECAVGIVLCTPLYSPSQGFASITKGGNDPSAAAHHLKFRVSDFERFCRDPNFWQQAQILFVKKNADLPQHAGQIAFPGGKKESKNETWEHCVLREIFEETQLSVPFNECLFYPLLPSLTQNTRYWIYPFIIWADVSLKERKLVADQSEISDVFWLTWSDLQSSKVKSEMLSGATEKIKKMGFANEYTNALQKLFPEPATLYDYQSPYGKIWGATALALNILERSLVQ